MKLQEEESRRAITLRNEPRGEAYKMLLDYAKAFCDKALLVVRPDMPLADSALAVLRRIEPYVQETRSMCSWPGTKLFGLSANVYTLKYHNESCAFLKQQVDGLFGWTQPYAPEDLCLLRVDGSPWLVTISHEHDAYLELSPCEAGLLLQAVPEIKPFLEM
jgi:hypothetical protein